MRSPISDDRMSDVDVLGPAAWPAGLSGVAMPFPDATVPAMFALQAARTPDEIADLGRPDVRCGRSGPGGVAGRLERRCHAFSRRHRAGDVRATSRPHPG